MTAFGFIAFMFIFWAWLNPHEFGQWIEKVRDPYRQKPIHQKK